MRLLFPVGKKHEDLQYLLLKETGGTWWILKIFSDVRVKPKSLKSLTALGHFLVALRHREGNGIR